MNTNAALFFVISLLQLTFAVLWTTMVTQRLVRKPSACWAGAATLIGASAALVAMRGSWSPWLTFVIGNTALLAGIQLLRLGVLRFLRRPARARGALLAMAGYSALASLLMVAGQMRWLMIGSALLWMGLFMHLAWIMGRGLRAEFGAMRALMCSLPMATVALTFLPRALQAISGPAAAVAAGPTAGASAAVTTALCVGLVVVNLNLLGIVMARVVLRLRHLSEHDALTGLYNRRTIEARLNAESQRQSRYGGCYALLSIDLDHFKQINDTLGHPMGDAVLREVAATLRRLARQVDTVARVGGEEFWVLLPGTDARGASQLAERVRATVAAGLTGCPDLPRVTASLGVAVAQRRDEPVEALLHRLDAALYRAKREGRNRSVLAPQAADAALSPAPRATSPTAAEPLAATH